MTQNQANSDPFIENRQAKKHELVLQTHLQNKQKGIFEQIPDIFSRLPLPRLEKNNYKFLFQNVKDNVGLLLEKEDKIADKQKMEQQLIDMIQVKLTKPTGFPTDEQLYKQRLYSSNGLFKSLIYLRNQNLQQLGFKQRQGDQQPFLIDSHFIELDKIKKEIPNLKLFLEDEQPLKRQSFQFENENEVIFQNKSFPSTYELDKRAEVMAKLYLLNLYREEGRKLLLMDRQDQSDLEKKRQINKIKQEMEMEKMKQGELIEDMDLLKQVYRILQWIQKKMNALAYEQFRNKNGDRATQIKKSLEKLKKNVNEQQLPMNKLKMLIAYKYKKGF